MCRPGDDLKTLLEFMRIKAPELNIRQNQLARIIFVFVTLNTLLFLIIFDGIGSVSLNLKAEVQQLLFVENPRPYIILGATVAIFFLFMRFGYLYYQGTKDIVSVHNVIGKILPFESSKGSYLLDLREGLMQQCKSNYIIQTIVVFLYPADNKAAELPFEDGPLGGSPAWRVWIVKSLMIAITISVGWLIAISQFMMLVVFMSFTPLYISLMVLVTFICYYGFYLEYVIRFAWKLRDWFLSCLAMLTSALAFWSFLANATLLLNYQRAAPVFECRMTWVKVGEISSPAKLFLSFLFPSEPSTKASQQPGREPPCK